MRFRCYICAVAVMTAAAQWGAAAGGQPACGVGEYGAECRSCSDDCDSGQWCVRYAGPQRVAGCHNCTQGRFDGDLDPLTPCEDCPGGETSDEAATVRRIFNPCAISIVTA